MAKTIEEGKVSQLIGLVERGKITVEDIKDAAYRDAVRIKKGG